MSTVATAPPAILALVMVGSPQKIRVSCRVAAYCLTHGAARDYAGKKCKSRRQLDHRLPRLLQPGVEHGQVLRLQLVPARQSRGERLLDLFEALHGVGRWR